MAAPYKIYINWTGTYTSGTMSGTFTDITSAVYDLNIIVSRKRDTKSIAIIRHFASGDFSIQGSNYDLLKTAIANGLPELIIKIEKYSTVAADYVEIWRGSVETRPSEMDDNRRLAKLSKFKTIDMYSDVEIAYTKTFNERFYDYLTAGKGIDLEDATTTQTLIDCKRLFSPNAQDDFLDVGWEDQVISKYYTLDTPQIVPGYYDGGFVYFWGLSGGRPVGIFIDSASKQKTSLTEIFIPLSIEKIVNIYKTMFNLFWYIDSATYTDARGTVDALQFKTPAQLLGVGTIDYTTESADFAKYSYLDINYFIRESYTMANSNVDVDHISQFYEYQILNDTEFDYPNLNIVTDVNTITLSDPEYNKTDLLLFVSEQTVLTQDEGTARSGASINGTPRTLPNYLSSLSYRLKNNLNDYRQLDSAKFNGSIQSLNANIDAPSLQQQPFTIDLDLLSDLDFTATIQTSLGDTYANEVMWNLKTNNISLICHK